MSVGGYRILNSSMLFFTRILLFLHCEVSLCHPGILGKLLDSPAPNQCAVMAISVSHLGKQISDGTEFECAYDNL